MSVAPDYDPTDPTWLAVNREGHLAPEQHALLREHFLFSIFGFLYSLITTVPLTMLVTAVLALALVGLVTPSESAEELAAEVGALAGLVAVIPLRLTHWPDWTAWRDLRAGRVLAGPGTIMREGTIYRPRLAGQDAAFLDLSWTNYRGARSLLPGAYTFYYLPYSRQVVAADPQQTAAWHETHADLLGAMAQAFEFQPADLAANRAGQLAPGQRRRLIRLAGARLVGAAGVAWLIWSLFADGTGDWGLWLIAALMAVTGCWLLLRAGQMLLDFQAGGVAEATGAVNKVFQRGSTTGGTLPEFTWTIPGHAPFGVPNVAYDALIAGGRYRVYYTPRSRVIVGVEPVA